MSEDRTTRADRIGRTRRGSWGRRLLKAVVLLVAIAAAVVVLFTWVFPWVEEVTQNPTLGVQLLRAPR